MAQETYGERATRSKPRSGKEAVGGFAGDPSCSLHVKDACTAFKSLDDCVASLHASNDLKIRFNCLKWNVTAVRPSGDAKSCEAPAKALNLTKAIHVLKPDANAKAEARNAERRAREAIKDASS